MTDDSKEKIRQHFGFGTSRMKELKVCEKCKAAVSADKRFCTFCHAELPRGTLYDLYKAHHRVCSDCGTVLPENGQYCPQCGKKQATSAPREGKMAL